MRCTGLELITGSRRRGAAATRSNAHSGAVPKDSIANASQLFAIDRTILSNRAGKLATKRLAQILASIDLALGREAAEQNVAMDKRGKDCALRALLFASLATER